MTHTGNGQPVTYEVSISQQVSKELAELAEEATQAGIRSEFRVALQTIYNRLRTKPLELGEWIGRLRHLRLVLHVGFVPPIRVWFGVHEEEPIVILQKFALILP